MTMEQFIKGMILKDVRLDDERVKQAKQLVGYKATYCFNVKGESLRFPAKAFVDAYWDEINNGAITEVSVDW